MADPLWNRKLEIMKEHGIDKRILDIGCNRGQFSSRFLKLGHTVVGIDINEKNLISASRKGLTTIKADLNKNIKLPNNSFSTIFALEIIEHLIKPENVIKESFRMLKRGGRFYVSVPYFGLIKRTLISLFFFDNIFQYNDPHIRFFSESSFKEILTKNGFKILKIYRLGRFYPMYMDMMAVCTK
jgi:2-polyprenyl-3-methyl-5-hydroxy-6-metoxy-1,4-benzoquinol methylase